MHVRKCQYDISHRKTSANTKHERDGQRNLEILKTPEKQMGPIQIEIPLWKGCVTTVFARNFPLSDIHPQFAIHHFRANLWYAMLSKFVHFL